LTVAPLWFARHLEPTGAELGEAGERLAARFLRARGLECLGRRVATGRGEVDLVALDRGRLVCIEVKTARAARGGPWRPGKRWRARAFARQRSAAACLARQGLGTRGAEPRLDLVEVWIGPRGTRLQIEHHTSMGRPISRPQ
jgi:putative endonuclease